MRERPRPPAQTAGPALSAKQPPDGYSSRVGDLLAFILLLGPLVFVHELGHLLAAKLVDVKVSRFSIGFGPPLVRFTVGDTEYCIAPIPLGGYVTLLGQSPHEKVADIDADRSLANKPLWARYLVLIAGPAANLVLPFILYFFFFLGQTALLPAQIGTVVDDSAAEAGGLRQNDRIVAIEGRDIRSWHDMSKVVAASPGQELRIQIERSGKRFDRFVIPRKTVRKNALSIQETIGRLGVTPGFYAPQVGIIDPQSPAAKEGLRTGDVITSINGEPVETVEELDSLLTLTGDSLIRLTYLRPHPVRGPLATYLWYDSNHALLLPRNDAAFDTGLLPANTFIRTVAPGSPAATAGLQPGDRVLAIDGHEFTKWEYLQEVLLNKQQEPCELLVQSPGQPPRTVRVQQTVREWTDVYKQDRRSLWFGALPYAKTFAPEPEPIRGRFTYALRAAAEETAEVAGMIWTVLRQMLTFERGIEELGSVIGLFDVAGTAAEQGSMEFLFLMALLSINLAFVNLLPIPILDGGHILFFTIEAIRRRPLGPKAREIASLVGLAVIIVLLIVAARNDILRYWW